MITLILTLVILAVLVAIAVRGRGLAGSSDVEDRDAQRLRCELNAMFGRAADHH
ncbi:hypothetical protein ACWDYH_34030 [Nocardia goodfellowii]|uniref:Uncharacterized protein n=1 Tax=Nocardia goodfellowii TaxID=882446 RepID=A0ABS4QQ34_9NOCA|nr:hypothetical protein [Nocardia goodfellowii]MBP2193818.1 hypothetical protein [Nocardia goodfellowii]